MTERISAKRLLKSDDRSEKMFLSRLIIIISKKGAIIPYGALKPFLHLLLPLYYIGKKDGFLSEIWLTENPQEQTQKVSPKTYFFNLIDCSIFFPPG